MKADNSSEGEIKENELSRYTKPSSLSSSIKDIEITLTIPDRRMNTLKIILTISYIYNPTYNQNFYDHINL